MADENKNVLWIEDKTEAQLTTLLLPGSVGGVASDTGNYVQRLHSGALKIVKNWTEQGLRDAILTQNLTDGEVTRAPSSNTVKLALDGKSSVGHIHDDRYYTETYL